MKNPIIKIAIAPIIIIAVVTGLTMFNKTSGIALANVLTQVEKINAYMHKLSVETTRTVNNSQVSQKSRATWLFSKEYGLKIIKEIPDSNSNSYVTQQEMYMLEKKKTLVTIIPAQKTYRQDQIDVNDFEIIKQQFNDPARLVNKILECNYKNIGRSTIDGIDVEGFQTTDPNYQGGLSVDKIPIEIDVKLWVNIKTTLPVKMEMNFKNNEINGSMVWNDFKWNVAVSESDFEPNIPPDYKNISSGQ